MFGVLLGYFHYQFRPPLLLLYSKRYLEGNILYFLANNYDFLKPSVFLCRHGTDQDTVWILSDRCSRGDTRHPQISCGAITWQAVLATWTTNIYTPLGLIYQKPNEHNKKTPSRQRVIIVTDKHQLVIHIYTHTHTYIQTLTVLRRRTVTSAHSATTSCTQGVLECVHEYTPKTWSETCFF